MIIRNGLDDRSAVGSGVLQVSFKGAVHMAWRNKCGPRQYSGLCSCTPFEKLKPVKC